MHVVNVTLPNADGMEPVSAAEVRALVRIIQRSCAPGDVTLDMIARALGMSRGALYAWMRDTPRKPGKVDHSRGIPYPAFYCLQVMATNVAATRADVFEPMWAAVTSA